MSGHIIQEGDAFERVPARTVTVTDPTTRDSEPTPERVEQALRAGGTEFERHTDEDGSTEIWVRSHRWTADDMKAIRLRAKAQEAYDAVLAAGLTTDVDYLQVSVTTNTASAEEETA